MSRLFKAPKSSRSPFAPRLSPEQEAARVAQSKAARKKTVEGIVRKASQHKAARWSGLVAKQHTTRAERKMKFAAALFGGATP